MMLRTTQLAFFFLLVNKRRIATTILAEAMKTPTLHERTVAAAAG